VRVSNFINLPSLAMELAKDGIVRNYLWPPGTFKSSHSPYQLDYYLKEFLKVIFTINYEFYR
jgi:hypothetical protein